MQTIIPTLWFDSEAEEAAEFYVEIFSKYAPENSQVHTKTYYDEASSKPSGKPAGSILTVGFRLNGQEFLALNGGPEFSFTEAISLMINCDNQEEVDYFWEKLSGNGGQESVCGWLKDKYGVSWQVVPTILDQLLADPDKEKAQRVMEAMLTMKKIEIRALQKAAE